MRIGTSTQMNRDGRATDVLLYCLAAVIIGAGAAGVMDSMRYPGISTVTQDTQDTSLLGQLANPLAGVDRLHILILGSDDMDEVQGRSDTIMVLFLNPEGKRAALLSLPRDLRVEIPGHGTDKINHAYCFGGVELTHQTVERLLGIDIDYYVRADFQAFEEIVETLGGVDIQVPFRMRKHTYHGEIDLQPGLQHLNGQEALGFVRYREDSDFKRAERQQQFLRALIRQKLRLTNIHRLIKAGGVILQAVDTDIEWPIAIQLARVLKQIPPAEIMTAVAPARDHYINGIYYAELRESSFFELLDDMDDHLDRPTGHLVTVEILNGCGQPGAAAAAGALLAEAGFEVLNTANADRFSYQRTIINYNPDAEAPAQQIKQILTIDKAQMRENRSNGDGTDPELVIVLGEDFRTASASSS